MNFIVHMNNSLNVLVLLLSLKYADLSIWTPWLVHIVAQQSHTNLPVRSVDYVNYLVSQFELFIKAAFGHCRYQHWGLIFLSGRIFCCIDQLIPQSNKLVKIRLSHCEILDQLELFVVTFPEYFEFYIQVIRVAFGLNKLSKTVLTSAKIHIVAATQLLQENSSALSHGWSKQNAGSSKKWFFNGGKFNIVFGAALFFLLTLFLGHCHLVFVFFWSISFNISI